MIMKEKIEEAKRLFATANDDQRYILKSLFPELKESDDERIANAIIRHLDTDRRERNLAGYFGVSYEEAVAWLKKQGEKHKVNILPQRGDIVRITKIADIAKSHKAKLREGDLCEVISSWAYPCDNGESVKYVRIKYPNGKKKGMPIRSRIYEWEIVEERQ